MPAIGARQHSPTLARHQSATGGYAKTAKKKVAKLTLMGIDPDGHGFPIGVMFTNGGWSHTITMTAIVPEPTTLWLLALAALALRRLRRFR